MREKIDPIDKETIAKQRKAFEALSLEEQRKEIEHLHGRAALGHAPTLREKSREEMSDEERHGLELAIGIIETIRSEEKGKAFIVGGYARDEAMRRFGYEGKPKDMDIEVYGVPFERLMQCLRQFGDPQVVGASFSVIKLRGLDISIPRRDSKIAKGHKGFVVEGDPFMTMEEATRRRDFTINALLYDPLTGEIIDKHGGLDDIQKRIIRVVDPEHFIEDPLRVPRAMQFAGRFGFSIEEETAKLCRSLDMSELSKERIGEEWVKLLLKSPRPSIGLEAARQLGILEKLHPEIHMLIDTPQDSQWHPEGDVWIHTKLVTDIAAEIVRKHKLSDDTALVILLAAFLHDVGKPATTVQNDKGRITAHGHPEAGIEPARAFLQTMHTSNVSRELVNRILPLIREHLFPVMNNNASDTAIRRLASRLAPATIQELVWVAEADQRGRGTYVTDFPEGEALLKKAETLQLQSSKPRQLLMGRDLIKMGFKPGEKFGTVLHVVFQAQLDGKVHTHEEAMDFAKELYTSDIKA